LGVKDLEACVDAVGIAPVVVAEAALQGILMTTNIRTAQYADAEAVLALAKPFATSFVVDGQAFHRSFSALLASPQAHLSVAETSQQLVGYALGFEHHTFYANGRVAWVEEIMVHEAFRRQGIGQLLMQEFEAWAVARGCKLVALATRRAAAFYQALGYEESAAYFRKLLELERPHER
jgi:GNAT superfamily N-acetyltransferase